MENLATFLGGIEVIYKRFPYKLHCFSQNGTVLIWLKLES